MKQPFKYLRLTEPPSRLVPVLACIIAALAFAATPGCAGGCGGAKTGDGARDLIAKLPAAGVNGFLVYAVDDAMSSEARKAVMEKLKADGEDVPMWLADVKHLAVVGDWGAKTSGGPPKCEAAMKNVDALITAKFGSAPLAVSKVKTKCLAAPASAPCLVKAKEFKDIDACIKDAADVNEVVEGTAQDPNLALVLVGTFDAKEALKTFLELPEVMDSAEVGGVELVSESLAVVILEKGAVAVGAEAQVRALAAAWAGKVPTIAEHPAIAEALKAVDASATIVMAGYDLAIQTTGAPISAFAGTMDIRDGLELKAWMRGGQTLVGEFQAALNIAKLALRQISERELSLAAAMSQMEAPAIKRLLEGVKELVHDVEVKEADGTMTITAATDIDMKGLIADTFGQVSGSLKDFIAEPAAADFD